MLYIMLHHYKVWRLKFEYFLILFINVDTEFIQSQQSQIILYNYIPFIDSLNVSLQDSFKYKKAQNVSYTNIKTLLDSICTLALDIWSLTFMNVYQKWAFKLE